MSRLCLRFVSLGSLPLNCGLTGIQEFGREALIWRQLCHPNLLPFFGLYYLDNRLCLVSPWMENGNVMEFLKKAPPSANRLSLVSSVNFPD
jgi:serine/threonine protein kinase